MSDGQTEACEANAPEIDWSKPVERRRGDHWVPADVVWQDGDFAVIKFKGKLPEPWDKASNTICYSVRNAPAPPQYRPFTYDELPDLVGRRFSKVDNHDAVALATVSGGGTLVIGDSGFSPETMFDRLNIDDNGQWVPAGVRQ